ncbi:DNA repair protein RecN [Haliovirga abyssi]|uniref:DNA repair protein RecN n=1 Tax=Haliovirga abyssi TaxID=2996794 RepID=A0AAU9D8X9_9FUSO|nr:DNA repair protein RecN [Haliovirga abyssi]BDU50046.1 DNA repair protein RecN [Haliovirga abyssi]
MLRELKIENLAIIKSLDLELENGLVVLTGETGAGKSIILDGINMLIGEKISTEMIRSDEKYVASEGVFEISKDTEIELKEMGIDMEDGEIIVRRELYKNGRGKIFLNGKRVPASTLKKIMNSVIDLVGQHEHQALLDKKYHIKLIDKFLDEDGVKLKKEVEDIYFSYKEIIKKIENNELIQKELKDKKELYEFQYNEIEEVDPKENEDEVLEEEYKKLFNAGKIKESLSLSRILLKDGEKNVMGMISKSKNAISNISRYGKEFKEILEKLANIYYDIEEAVYGIENSEADVEIDEYRLNKVVERLDKINNLKKKYGYDIKELLIYKQEIEEKLNKIDNNTINETELLKEKSRTEEKYEKKSKELTEKRRKIGEYIVYKLIEELSDLNMKGIKFEVEIKSKKEISKTGRDNVEFLVSTNIGEELKSLSKIVSGGEVSRIMLALKAIFSKVDNIPILIFDEIDTGIGGETVRKVSEKLRGIADNVQVVCITHSPQIAAVANQHFYIEKNILDEKTSTNVTKLNYEARVNEISRMLGGEAISEAVKNHAKELLKEGLK